MRLRFAPSPTGYLHVGGARTALFNWLLARQKGGVFILRIEDTDRDRSEKAHVDAILDGLTWLGLDWDEGPFFQADGVERHRRDALRLLAEGRAYRDFTTQEDFARARDALVEAGSGSVARLSRELASRVSEAEADDRAQAGEPHAVRFKIPDGVTAWNDMVHGETRFDNAEIDDLVILRSDGTPTYNLAVVSDDAEMSVTHVVRGDDHISNTPKQILLYEALGRPVPRFGHLPMILGPDGKRLSKRHGATAVDAYGKQGILPEAMVNFLALLGWSPGGDEEILSLDELTRRFSMERVLKKGAVFDPEKLGWLNGQYLARMSTADMSRELRGFLEREGAGKGEASGGVSEESFSRMVKALIPRSRTLVEMAEQAVPYLWDITSYDEKAARKTWYKDPDATAATMGAVLERLRDSLWDEESLEEALRTLAEERGTSAGKVFQPLRLALTGLSATPGIFDVLMILGRKRSIERLEQAIPMIRNPPRPPEPA